MLQVKALPELTSKTINLPHTEHFVDEENEYGIVGSKVVFDDEGFAIVTEAQAAGLEEFYAGSCVVIGAAPQKALKALAKAQVEKAKVAKDKHKEHLAAQAGFEAANAKARETGI